MRDVCANGSRKCPAGRLRLGLTLNETRPILNETCANELNNCLIEEIIE